MFNDNYDYENYGNKRKTTALSDIGAAIFEIDSQIDQATLKSGNTVPKNTLYFHSFLIKKALGDWSGACADITRAAKEDDMWLEEKLSYCK